MPWTIANIIILTALMMIIAGILKFISSWEHLLATLITLEFIALSLFLNMTSLPSIVNDDSFNSLFFLAIAVCEGALGLSILVLYARSKGHDILSLKALLQW
uniref:NADH-ubiquinone oxidoreductase chain 4L n=1 Tax=Sphaeroma serratum TaxID=96875 RepID=E3SXB6_SPHSR|nr:NADH dehydrogenase subunit 4L [Sphaeroma serratum]